MSNAESVRRLSSALGDAERQRQDTEQAVSTAMRELRTFRDNMAAGRVFRQLQPVACPSCEEVYTDEYRLEKETLHDCIVCGRDDSKAADATDGVEERLSEAVEEAKTDAARMRRKCADLASRIKTATETRDTANGKSAAVEAEIERRRSEPDIETDLIRIDAQIAELGRLGQPAADSASSDAMFLEKAIEVTKELYMEQQALVLRQVSDVVAPLARKFGMTDLETVSLKGNTHMDVFMKGGKKAFGKCEPGERMRLKAATTLAMIQVAEDMGIGRHPGLLIVDSIANNEVVAKDVEQLVTALASISASLPNVQVFVAGVASDAILGHVSCDNVIKNRPDGYLW